MNETRFDQYANPLKQLALRHKLADDLLGEGFACTRVHPVVEGITIELFQDGVDDTWANPFVTCWLALLLSDQLPSCRVYHDRRLFLPLPEYDVLEVEQCSHTIEDLRNIVRE